MYCIITDLVTLYLYYVQLFICICIPKATLVNVLCYPKPYLLAIIIISNEATIMVDGATIAAAGNSAFISEGPCMSECESVFADKGGGMMRIASRLR
jgi:hypothetical protein